MSARRFATRTALAAPLAVALVPALAASCADDPGHAGELMMVIQTDMSLPKDVDRARIEVIAYGNHLFDETYVRLGSDESLKLPGTLGVLVGEDPQTPVTMRVTAWQAETPRVLREAISTVPENRLAELRLPIQFLCDGSAVADAEGNVVSTCGEGQTCVAGACVASEIDSSTLPDYEDEEVFGGGSGEGDGTCFDTAECMRGAQLLEVLADGRCSAVLAGDANLALQTEGDGICGPAGCFVPLDANSDAGWQRADDGSATLPQAICDRLAAGTIVGVAAAPLSDACPLKDQSIPTCGPWSNTGAEPEPVGVDEPIALATGQNHPHGLVIDETNVYWTNRGSFGEVDASFRGMSKEGGAPTVILDGVAGARDLALDEGAFYFTASGVGADDGRVLKVSGTETIDLCRDGQGFVGVPVPEGIAVRGPNAFFTTFGDGGIYYANTSGDDFFKLQLDGPQNYPYRIAFDDSFIYWTNEGVVTSETPDGSVVRVSRDAAGSATAENPATVEALVEGEITPRALLVELGADDEATALWYTTFAADGAVKRIALGGQPGEPVVVASAQAYPNGLAIDGDFVYWTNRGDGTVMRVAKGSSGDQAPTLVAAGQVGPGPIAIDATHVYWANEGTSAEANGSIMRIAKPQ